MAVDLELGGAQVAAIALAVSCGALLIFLSILWTRQSRANAARKGTAETAELHGALRRLEGELPQLLSTMSAKLDAKMRALRELLHEARRTIEELRQLKESVAAGPACSPVDRHNDAPDDTTAPDAAGHLDQRASRRIDAAEQRAATPAPPATEDPRDQRYAHVYSLADAGLDAAQISAETGMHRGEVELVLSLRRRRIRIDRGSRTEPARVVHSSEEATV